MHCLPIGIMTTTFIARNDLFNVGNDDLKKDKLRRCIGAQELGDASSANRFHDMIPHVRVTGVDDTSDARKCPTTA
jgi:hypothetical protein